MSAQLPNIAVTVQSDLAEGAASLPDSGWLADAVRHGLAQALVSDAIGQVSLLLTDDATVRELNRQYRGLDEATDVLSFSAEHAGHWQGEESPSALMGAGRGESNSLPDFPIPDDEPPPLGDIVISVTQAIRQADEQGVELRQELALLIVHGALHLLGHDHYDDGERDEMQRLERAALAAIFGDSEG